MKRNYFRFFGLSLFLLGIVLLVSSRASLTGAAVGVLNLSPELSSVFGIILVVLSIMFFVSGGTLEMKVEDIQELADSHHWIKYRITSDSELIDKRIDRNTGKSSGLGYLNDPVNFPETRTPIQDRIEKMVTGGKKILRYAGKEVDRESRHREYRGETVNRRNTYAEQFHEPHAAGGGRIIDVKGHLALGRLKHFNEFADGEYIWVIDEEGNFIVANRGGFDKDGDLTGMVHEMYQMSPDLGSGERHEKKDKRKTTLPHSTLARGSSVYGAGEVTIRKGLISRYNADSGHYVKISSDLDGPHEPDNFVRQSIEAFKYFSKKLGWKEIRRGAKYGSAYYRKSVA